MTRLHAVDHHRRPVGGGFTLVELLVVVSIIAVLVAILIPALGGARASARKTTTNALMTTVGTAINQFKAQNQRLPGYFSQAELGDQADDLGFTQMENALLELAGGVLDPNADASPNNVITITIGGRSVKIDVLAVGSSEGPGFLALPAKGIGTADQVENGLGPVRRLFEQATDVIVPPKFQMPDVVDAWGKPVMLWSKNELAGANPQFADIKAAAANTRRSRFYWQTNRGYLSARTQDTGSALGSTIADAARVRTMAALLGHSAFPDPSVTDPDEPAPIDPKGDYVLHSAGADGVFLKNGGTAALEYRYLPKGAAIPAAWSTDPYELMERTDDLVQGGT